MRSYVGLCIYTKYMYCLYMYVHTDMYVDVYVKYIALSNFENARTFVYSVENNKVNARAFSRESSL